MAGEDEAGSVAAPSLEWDSLFMTWTKRNNFERPEIARLKIVVDVDGWGEIHRGGGEKILNALRKLSASVRQEWEKMLLEICDGREDVAAEIKQGVSLKMHTWVDAGAKFTDDLSEDSP